MTRHESTAEKKARQEETEHLMAPAAKAAAAKMLAADRAKESGTPLPETASLHEKAVQAVARGDVPTAPPKARKRAEKRSHAVSTAVHTHVQLDKRVLEAAQRIVADSDNTYTRYEIIDHETAVVR